MNDVSEVIKRQRAYFDSGETLSYAFRRRMLLRLKAVIAQHLSDFSNALYVDLGKSAHESYMCELGLVLSEIRYMLKHLRRFMRREYVRTPLSQFAARSYTESLPLGCALIMSPWNYPVLLSIGPLIDAIAAGCTAVLKPSAYSPKVSALLAELLGEAFNREYICVISGGRQENALLLEQKFDMVFFTGSQAVGKEVLRHCAETLTPAVLELGGKSPCIVDSSAHIRTAARRIVFGKLLNCGQTCVAPDYILADASIAEELTQAIIAEIKAQYGNDPLQNPNYGHMINKKQFDRVAGLIKGAVYGGNLKPETLQIAPTVMTDVSFDDPVMQQEIFGPLIPILTYTDFEQLIPLINARPHPLALYIFSEDKAHISHLLSRVISGGCCINDTVIQLATSRMGFGGVGESGMGAYHGRTGFDAFSHRRSVVDKKRFIDLKLRYQPYKGRLSALILKLFLR